MEQNSLNTILVNTYNSVKRDIDIDLREVVNSIKNNLNNTFNSLLEANKIDIEKNNGFLIDIDTINRICDKVLSNRNKYGDEITTEIDEEKKIVFGKEISNIGNIVTIFDGNTYTLLELLLNNVLYNNSCLFVYSGYMFATNTYILELVKEIYKQNNLSIFQFNEYIDETYENILSLHTNIDLVMCIGSKQLQREVLKTSRNKVVTSGYDYFDLYIESFKNVDFINKIITKTPHLNIYALSSLGLDDDNIIMVNDIDEAIYMINTNGDGYSASIFTDNPDSSNQFVKEIKSDKVMINSSPTLERIIDIKEADFYKEKTIIYPLGFKIDKKNE